MYTCVCACECGNMTKFIRQKGCAECKHSETKNAGEVDQRHKLTLSTWSDKVNLSVRPDDELLLEVLRGAMDPHHQDDVSHCTSRTPFLFEWEVHLCRSRGAQT